MLVAIRSHKTGKLLEVPKQMYEIVYKNNQEYELLSGDIREQLKPSTINPIDAVTEHIAKVKAEVQEKEEKAVIPIDTGVEFEQVKEPDPIQVKKSVPDMPKPKQTRKSKTAKKGKK